MDIRLVDYESTTAAWLDKSTMQDALLTQKTGLIKNNFPSSNLDTWIGRVNQVDDIDLGGQWQSRNNALAALGLEQGTIKHSLAKLIKRYSAPRIGLVMGTSTSSIDRTETAYTQLNKQGQLIPEFQQPLVHNPHAPSLFVANYTGIKGPAITINTACSSSAKVFATASRWLEHDIVDAVLVGGVDTLCLTVLHGFNSLQLISKEQCKPFDEARDGINLGEAAGYALLTKKHENQSDCGTRLIGYGESSDAHHMSHPHPEGLGAKLAIEQALTMANLTPEQIDYINLHGTASQANDLIEGTLIAKIFKNHTIATSTKALIGHTLGAAGITEAIIAIQAAKLNIIPGTMNLTQLDSRLNFNTCEHNIERETKRVMTNSFGFGGNNCTLIFEDLG